MKTKEDVNIVLMFLSRWEMWDRWQRKLRCIENILTEIQYCVHLSNTTQGTHCRLKHLTTLLVFQTWANRAADANIFTNIHYSWYFVCKHVYSFLFLKNVTATKAIKFWDKPNKKERRISVHWKIIIYLVLTLLPPHCTFEQ